MSHVFYSMYINVNNTSIKLGTLAVKHNYFGKTQKEEVIYCQSEVWTDKSSLPLNLGTEARHVGLCKVILLYFYNPGSRNELNFQSNS